MINVAMIGCGYIGDCHIAAYKSMPSDFVKLTAIVERNPEVGRSAAEKAGCKWFMTLQEANETVQIDVVDICVPTFLHEQFAVQAAQMGKHVLCEKPVTLTMESFDRMYDACHTAGVKFMVGQVVRFFPEFVKFREILNSGSLGKLHMLSEHRLAQHPAWTTWHRDPDKSGGGLFDLNTHDIDYIYSLFGMPKQISAVGWKSNTGCWNHVVTTMQWEDKQAVCETSLEMTGAFPFSVGVRAVGDGGSVEYRSTAGANIKEEAAVSSFRMYLNEEDAVNVSVDDYDPFREELESFLRAIVEDREVPIHPEETRNVLRILLATKESLENRKIVCL